MKAFILCCFIFASVSTVHCSPYARTYGQLQQKGKVIPGATDLLNNISEMVTKVFYCISKSPRGSNNEALTENLLTDRLQTVLQGLLNCVSSLKENPLSQKATSQVTRQRNAKEQILNGFFKNYKN